MRAACWGRLTKMVVEGALEGELDDHLGYGKNDPEGRNGRNSRDGRRGSTLQMLLRAVTVTGWSGPRPRIRSGRRR